MMFAAHIRGKAARPLETLDDWNRLYCFILKHEEKFYLRIRCLSFSFSISWPCVHSGTSILFILSLKNLLLNSTKPQKLKWWSTLTSADESRENIFKSGCTTTASIHPCDYKILDVVFGFCLSLSCCSGFWKTAFTMVSTVIKHTIGPPRQVEAPDHSNKVLI